MGNILDVNEKKVAYQSDVTDEKDESQVPNTFYCEGTVLENSRHDSCGIGMKSNHATIVYHSGGGIFGGANGVINTGKPFETGDIIGCYVTLAVYKSNDEVYNLCSFYRNSEKSADSVIFEGSKLSAGLFLETLAADTCSGGGIIDLNVGDHAFLFKPGNSIFLLGIIFLCYKLSNTNNTLDIMLYDKIMFLNLNFQTIKTTLVLFYHGKKMNKAALNVTTAHN